jgi:hypothetical protein
MPPDGKQRQLNRAVAGPLQRLVMRRRAMTGDFPILVLTRE